MIALSNGSKNQLAKEQWFFSIAFAKNCVPIRRAANTCKYNNNNELSTATKSDQWTSAIKEILRIFVAGCQSSTQSVCAILQCVWVCSHAHTHTQIHTKAISFISTLWEKHSARLSSSASTTRLISRVNYMEEFEILSICKLYESKTENGLHC